MKPGLKAALAVGLTSASVPLAGCTGTGREAPDAAPSSSARVPAPAMVPAAGALGGATPRTRAGQRAACVFAPGAMPADTLDVGAPLGKRIPIEHFVVVMQENRSFDHYFQKLPERGQPDADVAPPAYDNEDPSGEGEIVHPYPTTDPCLDDVPHSWIAVHHQINGGAMNGFVSAANPRGRRALAYYDADTLPYYYALANTFAIGDRYFAAVPGPTFPNRMFFLAASSFGHAVNTAPPPRDEERTLFHQLEAKGLSWVLYAQGRTFEEQMFPRLHAEKGEHFRPIEKLFEDAASGNLPFFAWVESTYGGREATDEHAPADVQMGQAFVAKAISAVLASPAWPSTAVVLTYDEHGGFFDHVPPPAACPPDEHAPRVKGLKPSARFDRLGVRVPFIVVSPFAKRHFVSHRTYTHTSVLRLVQARAELGALTARDANDEPPYDLFDFEHPPFVLPPTLPAPVEDRAELLRCMTREVAEEKPTSSSPGTSPALGETRVAVPAQKARRPK